MKLTRQQQREMFRRLNDPAKMRVVLNNISDKEKVDVFDKKIKKRVFLIRLSIGVLLLGIVAMFVYAFG